MIMSKWEAKRQKKMAAVGFRRTSNAMENNAIVAEKIDAVLYY